MARWARHVLAGVREMIGATILVVDDEPKIVDIVRAYLARDGFRVVVAGDGGAALQAFRRERPALVVLDLMLPGMSGWDVCREVRRESEVPIVMLTARDDVTDTVLGLELGADDYVTKPFEPRELVARVRAHLRRAQAGRSGPDEPISLGDVSIDPLRREVTRRGEAVALTRGEFDLLHALAAQPGRIFSRSQLLGIVGSEGGGNDRAIDSHVRNVRAKLEADPKMPRLILTVVGFGYKAAARDARASGG
jgi:DNA-binding response OmpR family regulator